MARGKHEAAKKSEKTKPEKKPKRSGGAKKAVLIIEILFLVSVPYVSIKHLLSPVKIFLINTICGAVRIYKHFGNFS